MFNNDLQFYDSHPSVQIHDAQENREEVQFGH